MITNIFCASGLVVPLLQPAPAKLVQPTPDPPTRQNMLVLTYQHNNWKIEAYSHAAKYFSCPFKYSTKSFYGLTFIKHKMFEVYYISLLGYEFSLFHLKFGIMQEMVPKHVRCLCTAYVT